MYRLDLSDPRLKLTAGPSERRTTAPQSESVPDDVAGAAKRP
jgi:hypothetical protein